MTDYNTRALVLRTNANHSIRCSAAEQRRLVIGLNDLLSNDSLSKENLLRLVNALPSNFFADNGFDTPTQYSRLLWDALETSELSSPSHTVVSHVTNFNAPVQAQILQTGANAKAKVKQNSPQNQLYAQMMMRELEKISAAVKQELDGEGEQTAALAIVEMAKTELGNRQVKPGKIQKILSGLSKWSGERITNAVDVAIETGVKYGMTGSMNP
jgi:hypothetical protein